MAQQDDESKYYFKWGLMSWICVAIGAAFVLVFSTLEQTPIMIGYIGGALIAIVGGIAFGFQPKAALDQQLRPMTPRAERKARQQQSTGTDDGPGTSGTSGTSGSEGTGSGGTGTGSESK